MADTPWHKRYHSDALSGYLDLTLEERGGYTTLLDLLYDRREPIVDNDRLLAGYLGASVRKMRSIVGSLIEKGKIYRTSDGRLSNRRFEKEIENELKTSRKRAENGSEGGRKRAENAEKSCNINACGQAKLDENSSPNQKPEARSQNNPPLPPVTDVPATPPVEKSEAATPDEIDRKELADLKTGIVIAFRDAGSMTLAPDTHRAATWVAQGYRPAVILAVVREVLARHPNVKSLSYFDNPIREAHETAAKQPTASPAPDEGKRLNFLRGMVQEWQREPTTWPTRLGPRPGERGCTVPANILAEFGIQSRERRAA